METLQKELKELTILLNNNEIYLTGSIALWYQGVDLKREKAHDIDFVCSNDRVNLDFLPKTCNIDYIDDGYEDSLSICYIDFMDNLFDIRYCDRIEIIEIDGVKMQIASQIIEKKLEYAIDKFSSTADKHKKDLELLGVDVDGLIEVAEKKINIERQFRIKESVKHRIIGNLSGNDYTFKFSPIEVNEYRPSRMSDTIAAYKIKSIHNNIDIVEKQAREKIKDFKNIVKKGYDFSGHCKFPFGLESYYNLSGTDNEGEFILKICHPYTG